MQITFDLMLPIVRAAAFGAAVLYATSLVFMTNYKPKHLKSDQ